MIATRFDAMLRASKSFRFWNRSRQPRRRWSQFRLRTLMLFVTAICIFLAYLERERIHYARRLEAFRTLDGIERLYGGREKAAHARTTFIGKLLKVVTNRYDRVFDRVEKIDLTSLGWNDMPDASLVAKNSRRRASRASHSFNHIADHLVADETLSEFRAFRHLESLNLYGAQNITDTGIRHVAECKRLEVLNLGHTQLTNAGLAELANLSRLRQLGLSKARITDAGLQRIGKLTGLTHLNLSDTPITNLNALSELRHLECLDVSGTKISDSDLRLISEMTNLRSLNVSGTQITDEGLRFLAPLRSLYVLSLGRTRTGDEGLAHLGELTQLKELCISSGYPVHPVTDEGLMNLHKLQHLERLEVAHRDITDASLKLLGRFTRLAYLDISRTQISENGRAWLRSRNPICVID